MRSIPQRELRNDISSVLRDVSAGESVEVTVRGKTVAELRPPRNRALTPRAHVVALLTQPSDATWLDEIRAGRNADERDERELT